MSLGAIGGMGMGMMMNGGAMNVSATGGQASPSMNIADAGKGDPLKDMISLAMMDMLSGKSKKDNKQDPADLLLLALASQTMQRGSSNFQITTGGMSPSAVSSAYSAGASGAASGAAGFSAMA